MSNQVQQQIRENAMELQDFLKDLQGWEQAVKEKDKQLKGQRGGEGASTSSVKADAPPVRGRVKASVAPAPIAQKTPAAKSKEGPQKETTSAAGHTYDYFRDKWDKFDVDAALEEVDKDGEEKKKEASRKTPPTPKPARPAPTAATTNGTPAKKQPSLPATRVPDASSPNLLGRHLPLADPVVEKDKGNELFREGKYTDAMAAYSRSIGLQPTAIAFANRAMAALKLRRYEEAEADCTEALLLDDRYVKAYSRRGSARRELKKYLPAVEDFEFALRLEPENKELKKQYMEVRDLCEKEARLKPSPSQQIPVRVLDKPTPAVSPPPATSAPPVTKRVAELEKPTPAIAPPPATSAPPVTKRGSDLERPTPAVAPPPATSAPPVTKRGAERVASQSVQGGSGAGREGSHAGTSVRLSALDGAAAPVAGPAGTPSVARDGGQQASAPSSSAPVPSPPVLLRGPWAATAHAAQSILVEKMAATAAAGAGARAGAGAGAGLGVRTHTELLTMWKTFEGSPERQANILRGLDPAALPKIFKDSLTPNFIVNILNNLATCFLPVEAEYAAAITEGLSRCARFSMIVRCITKKQKEEMRPFWELATSTPDDDLRGRFSAMREKYNG